MFYDGTFVWDMSVRTVLSKIQDMVCPRNLVYMPSRLYKYYSFNREEGKTYNEGRLCGGVYMSSPLDFNDPCDCQLSIVNNTTERELDKGDGWLENKLEELGYTKEEIPKMAKQLENDEEFTIEEVYNRQLEKLGVLCLSETYIDTLMWGYYAHNEGYCIEYDTRELVERLVIGYVNQLDYRTTALLYEREDYKTEPLQRKSTHTPSRSELRYIKRFNERILPQITNRYLLDKGNNEATLHFVQNVFLKRFAGGRMKYSCYLKSTKPALFFDNKKKSSRYKYFKKTNVWKHEKEFRIIASLGGNFSIDLGTDIIRKVYLAYNIKSLDAVKIAKWMNEFKMEAPLYIMRRNEDYSLSAEPINKELLAAMNYKEEAEEYLWGLRRLKFKK